jgi:hypothetical protein
MVTAVPGVAVAFPSLEKLMEMSALANLGKITVAKMNTPK